MPPATARSPRADVPRDAPQEAGDRVVADPRRPAAANRRGIDPVGELQGALNGAAAVLPLVLSYGLVVYGPMGGPAAAGIGLAASLAGMLLGGLGMLVLMPWARTLMPCASTGASAALILLAAVVAWLQDPSLRPDADGGTARLLALAGGCVALSGLLLALIGLLRAGSLVRFVPQPVLGGFMNGVAVLMLLSQLAPLAGLSPDALARGGWAALRQGHPAALLVALVTTATVLLMARRWPRWPVALIGLVLATAAVQALQAGLAARTGATLPLPVVGPLQPSWPGPSTLAPLFGADGAALLARHGGVLLVSAVLLAVIGALESVLNLAAVDQALNGRSDPNRMLVALGVANLASGLFAGLPVVYQRLRAMATASAGGRSALACGLTCVLLAAAFALALPLIARLPTAVIAGIILMLAWTLVDPWTLRLLRQHWHGDRSRATLGSLMVVAAVCGMTAVAGFVAGVALGVLLSMLLFIAALNRSLVRLRFRADEVPSRRVYPAAAEARLAPLRRRIQVIELEGALFFGNADRAQQAVEQVPPDTAFVVLDLRRISTLDASGAVALQRLDERLRRRGTRLLLAGVTADNRHGQALKAHGVWPEGGAPWPLFADTDLATEHAEAGLLKADGAAPAAQALPLAQAMLFEGLDAAAARRLAAVLRPRRLAAGERLFAQGDPGDALYLLTEGSVSVVDAVTGQRYVSFSPGMCFGETAVLDGQGRSASAVADVASEVHALPAAAMADLQRDDPALAAQVYRNLAHHLSTRLRAAAAAWRRAAG